MLVTKDLKRLRTNRSSPRLPGIRNLSPSLAPNPTWRVWSSEGSLAANCDFNFHSADSTEVVEYHVNATYAFDERLSTLPFGASLSVQKPINSWPVVLMGQDGAIFKLFLFLAKIWVCPNGERGSASERWSKRNHDIFIYKPRAWIDSRGCSRDCNWIQSATSGTAV